MNDYRTMELRNLELQRALSAALDREAEYLDTIARMKMPAMLTVLLDEIEASDKPIHGEPA